MNSRHVRLVVFGVSIVLLAVVGFVAFQRLGGLTPPELTVTWGGSEGHPSCVYRADDETVVATLTMVGMAPPSGRVTIEVGAYADENTSDPVSSYRETVEVSGSMQRTITVTVPVDRAPHVDEDGEAACRLDVKK